MPFWLHEPRVVMAIKSIPWRIRFFILLAATAIFVVGWGLLIYAPLQRKLVAEYQKIAALERERKSLNNTLIQHTPAQIRSVCLKTSLQLQEVFYPSLQKSVNIILQLLQNREISCRGVYYQDHIKKDFYKKNYVLIDGKGSFRNVLTFLCDAQNLAIPVKFEALSLRKSKKDTLTFQVLIRVIDLTNGGSHEV